MESFIDSFVEEMIDRIKEQPNSDAKEQLDKYLFEKYCEKGYLTECEPEFCSFRYTSSCRYIKALHEIQEKYGLKVFIH